jgi:hypothetical protein
VRGARATPPAGRAPALVGNSSGGGGYTDSDLLDVDPLLDPLGDNGGPTPTHALLAGSPALNAGAPDQRGVVRSGGVNIGAYQANASTFFVSAPDMVQSGVPFEVTVTAVDLLGQVAVGYTGTVSFTTTDTDPGVVLPADYTFTLNDGGVHTFTDTGLGETTATRCSPSWIRRTTPSPAAPTSPSMQDQGQHRTARGRRELACRLAQPRRRPCPRASHPQSFWSGGSSRSTKGMMPG